MTRIYKILVICAVGLAAAAGLLVGLGLQPSAAHPAPVRIQSAEALNLGFEGTYTTCVGLAECTIAPDWELWYTTDWPGEGSIAEPRAMGVTSPRLEGDKAQRVYRDDGRNFDACAYQQVSGITVGHYIRFSVWGRVGTSLYPHEMQTRVGIDPNGGTDPRDVQYELNPDNWDPYTQNSGEWQRMSVAIKAVSETATLYACAHPQYPTFFEVFWDQAEFAVLPEKLFYLPLVARRHFTPPPPGSLYNPDLEREWGGLYGYQLPITGYTNVYVAPYWMPFWNDDYIPSTGENKQPEYNYVDGVYYPYRVRSGLVAQQYGLSAWGGFEAGIYQVISGTVPSDTVKFAIWGLGWSSNKDHPDDRYSDVREGLNFRVGIDPYGGESYTSTEIIWSEFYDPYDEWHPFEVTATVQSDQISVWAYTYPTAYWIRFNQVFWDDASLVVVDPP